MKVTLRNQRLTDAKRFYEILSNPNFKFFLSVPSVEAEREWLKKNAEKRRKKTEYNYAILYGGQLVGGAGIKFNPHSTHIGEIGYFIDEPYWGQGIAPKAVSLLEKICWKEGLARIEIEMLPENKASVRVAEKCGYKREGRCAKKIRLNGKYHDAYLYAKVKT